MSILREYPDLDLDGVELHLLRHEDIFLIKDWRNAQMDVLRQKAPLTDEDQQRYYDRVIKPSQESPQPEQILFSMLKDGECIGYGGLVHIFWQDKRAEVSFLMNPKLAEDPQYYTEAFSDFLKMIKEIAFNQLGFSRIFTETFDVRPRHIAILENSGFELEDRIRGHVIINEKPVDSLIHGCLSKESV